jgi:response regulator RpfG family c-di-GMP phosphodiesterase
MKIFVIDFATTNNISEKLATKFLVFTEKKNGRNAYVQIAEIMPDIIVVNFNDKPSHGKQTAEAIKKRKKTSLIPIYFIDGKEKDIEKVRSIGPTTTLTEFENFITNISH